MHPNHPVPGHGPGSPLAGHTLPNTHLVGVSCPSASECVAVGAATQGHLTKTDAEKWAGSAWKLQDPGIPAGSQESALVSVSCPATADCTAVGWYVNGSGEDIVLAAQYS